MKRAEGVAGGRPVVMQDEPPPPNAFQDWLSSFDDPLRHDVKRIMMRSDDAAKQFAGDLKHESQHFKSRVLGEASDWDLYLNRIHYSGYGIWAAKSAEKRYGIGFKAQDSDATVQKKKTRKDLFNLYKVNVGEPSLYVGKGEPSLKTLGKLLRESEPGRDRNPKKQTKCEHAAKDMAGLFSGGFRGMTHQQHDGKGEVDADIGSMLGSSLGASLSQSLRNTSKSAMSLSA